MIDFLMAKYNYWIYVVLMMIGFYAMMGKRNLVKKLIGMNIFQTFFSSSPRGSRKERPSPWPWQESPRPPIM